MTGIDISADGERFVCRTDVTNGYVRSAGDPRWKPLFSPTTMSRADFDPLPRGNKKSDGLGVAGIRIAPSNKNVIYASFMGYVWKSIDGGRTIFRTNLKQVKMFANAGRQRLFNRIIDVHPQNADLVVIGTWGEGVWYTKDGGLRWSSIDVPPAANGIDGQPGIHLVLFDPARPERIFIFITGVGLFITEEGVSGKFNLLRGGPLYSSNLVAGSNGSVYLCEQTTGGQGGRIWRHTAAKGWASSLPPAEPILIAIDPFRPERSILLDPNGGCMMSYDHCATFEVSSRNWSREGADIPWTGNLKWIFFAEARFHPKKRNHLVVAQGVGVAKVDTSTSNFSIVDWSAGIEELCATSILAVPNGKTFLTAWDKPIWRVDDLSSYSNDFRHPVPAGKSHDPDLVAFASTIDFAPEDPNFLVATVSASDKTAPGFTADGGQTWRVFEGAPSTGWGQGGSIAAASRSNIVLLPSNNATGVYTLDGGKSWQPIRLDGTTPTAGFANAFYVARRNLAADKARPGVFALVYTTIKDDQYGGPLGGVWVTSDGARTWSQIFSGAINDERVDHEFLRRQGMDPRQFWQCQLEYVPKRPAELVYTPHSDFPSDRFFWSEDDGRTWSTLHRHVRNVRAFGFGKGFASQPRPALYFWGEVKGREGLYGSLDWFASDPILISQHPSEKLGKVTCVAGSPDRFGRIFVGTSCAGWIKIDIEI